MTFQIDFRTKDHANCTAYVHEESESAALAWVRANLAVKIGPFSNLHAKRVIDTSENHRK